ncbi:hypothetical protein EMIHUDRAFT_194322 [Emiliania huxleyi CCMP1516]|uniref:Uncharacterized protein n=2 Tax=Emiliania huxleyi TaxID=2903 RepID=A0A0D3L1B2_EMIH1|nr:hypothetical protein EMIHUDRAFT_194322 [Emiliania huxleyi CCMP1516]EOD41797.1 hypothetical protein EMIHUDRAFT_194322 [Emiliania huxleyi CCMP1516]|eukprot:XP_005794226.1 hypothetical protein EMIHUDRAFT_194322 [Emiliania huxleyi CCMP1516]
MLAKFTLLATLATASALKVSKTSVPKPVLKLRGGEIDIPTVNLVNALYYGGYGVPLLVNHDKFFGPDGIISYTKKNIGDESAIGLFFSRFTGVMFCALSAGYLIDKESTMLAKQFGLGSLGFVPLLFMNSQDDTNYKAKMWKMQHLIHLPLTALTLLKAFKKE